MAKVSAFARQRSGTPLDKQRGGLGRVTSIPAPVGGLNARDSIANMPPTDAILMENWFPYPSYIQVRNGMTAYVTGFSSWVESLMIYSGASSRKMFAASGTAFYNATTAGAVGAAVQSGLTNARWESVNFGTSAGQYMYACNAVDKPRLYDGTNWVAVDGVSVPAITGVTTTTLRSPAVWKSRIWFVQDGTMKAWYLPTSSIGGAAQSIDFGAEFKLGGYLQSIITMSIDNASSLDDYIGFLSSEGELLVYRGTDPAVAGVFGIVGRYRLGRPIGRRCFFRYGADTIIICADGFTPFSSLLMSNRDNLSKQLSYKILNLVNSDVQSYSANFGWQGILYPIGNKIIINVPQVENNTQYQYVMNTITGAWCKFTGWNACCFSEMGDNLFFGGSTAVYQCDTGDDDNGSYINSNVAPAYSYFGTRGTKLWTMIRPVFQTSRTLAARITANTDFATPALGLSDITSTGEGSTWDLAPWDTSPWAVSDQVQRLWQSFPCTGFAVTPTISMSTKSITAKLHSIDYVYEPGGIL